MKLSEFRTTFVNIITLNKVSEASYESEILYLLKKHQYTRDVIDYKFECIIMNSVFQACPNVIADRRRLYV